MRAGRDVAPSGVVTFLFTDIEGSTWLVQHLGDDWDATLHDHYRLLREAWTAHNGYEVDTEGDAFFVAFADASDAIRAAIDGQRRLAAHRWIGEAPLRVRIGMHTGEARVYDGDYVGLAVHQAARVKSAAHGGQILVSQETRDAADGSFEYLELGLHRLKDLAQPVRICQVLDASLPQEFPPPKSLSVMPNNFPIQSTSFVGRDDDIAQMRDLLSVSRIVTLTGAGGVGKTRLALQVGAELIDDYPDGAWLIDLARLADPSAVATQIADVLGVREQPGRPITTTLVDHLRAKDMLLIVDNCEHLIDACAEIVHLVASSCANVRILATSREALNVAGEHSHRLRSLSVPELDGDLEPVAKAEAVELFCQRVRAARADFELTVDNAGAVTQICRRLDGLPLAIELAAARCRSMSPLDVAGRLDDRFRLLTGGSRMALPRQRTLEATVTWSYELLRPEEQRVFERLSVFAGGCNLDAAERLCRDEEIGTYDVDDAIATLVDRSLVVVEDDARPSLSWAWGGRRPNSGVDSPTRYRLLETLRQFGRDRLLERGELAKMRDRHLDWLVDLAAQLFAQHGLDTVIDADEANLRAAIEWAIETGDHARGLRVAANVRTAAGHLGDQERWYAQLLAGVGEVPPDIAARALAAAGGVSLMVGDWITGTERFSKAIEAAKPADDKEILSKSLLYAGACRYGLRDDDTAMTLMEEGLRVATAAGYGDMVRLALVFLAHSECGRDLDRALELAERCDAMSRQDGSLFDRAHALEALGLAHALRGDLGRSAAFLAESMPLMAQVYAGCAAHLLETAAATLIMTESVETGAELVGSAERIREETGDKPRPWERLVQEEWLPRIRSELDAASYEQAVARGRSRRWEDALAFAAEALTRARDED